MTLIREQFQKALHEDGKDHINISSSSKTEIGYKLNLEFRRRFNIPHLGDFASPRCFANWMSSGGDDFYRNSGEHFDNRGVPRRVFRLYMLYAKYYQLEQFSDLIKKSTRLLRLPFVNYKQYVTGIREFNKVDDYVPYVKDMCAHIANNPDNQPFDWRLISEDLLDLVEERVVEIAEMCGTPRDQIVEISKADEYQRRLQEAHEKMREGSKTARKSKMFPNPNHQHEPTTTAAALQESSPPAETPLPTQKQEDTPVSEQDSNVPETVV